MRPHDYSTAKRFSTVLWLITLYNLFNIKIKSRNLQKMRLCDNSIRPLQVNEIIRSRYPRQVPVDQRFLKSNMIKSDFDFLPPVIQDYSIKLKDYPSQHKLRLNRLKTVCTHQKYQDIPNLLDEYKDIIHRRKLSPSNEPKFFTSPSAKITYCSLTKCGSSNWRQTLVDVEGLKSGRLTAEDFEGNEHFTSHKDKPGYRFRRETEQSVQDDFNRYNRQNIKRWGGISLSLLTNNSAIEKYNYLSNLENFKFIFARDPLERLLSAYRDKFQPGVYKIPKNFGVRETNGHGNLKTYFKKEYRNIYNCSSQDNYRKILELDTLSFHSFLYQLLGTKIGPHFNQSTNFYIGDLHRHWFRFIDLCRVCSINWDFIGKVETVDVDSEVVMDKAGVKGLYHLGLHGKTSDNVKVINYFKGLSKNLIREIYELYKADFEIFGYTVNDWLWEHLVDE